MAWALWATIPKASPGRAPTAFEVPLLNGGREFEAIVAEVKKRIGEQ